MRSTLLLLHHDHRPEEANHDSSDEKDSSADFLSYLRRDRRRPLLREQRRSYTATEQRMLWR